MLARLSSYRQPAALIRARIQTTLNGLADRDVLVLDSLPHSDARMVLLPRVIAHDVRKVKVENDFSLVHAARDDEVRVHHAVVPVDHEVWINPVVKRAVAFSHRARLRLGAFGDDWAPLQAMITAVFDHVFAVVEDAVETFVQVRHVITAVEIVVDEDFPVAVEAVISSFEPVKLVELERFDLLDQTVAEKI